MIPYGRQTIDNDDIEAVLAALNSDWLTQGPRVGEFEEAIATAVEARFAVAFASGTTALHAAAAAAPLGPGDLVATSPLSFVASANCARYVGAQTLLVDIDFETMNIDLSRLPSVAGLVAVHYAGLPVDLASLGAKRPRVVIEDAAHALGARTPSGPVGNCADSDMCVFSFHPVKAITTGEGGAVTTNHPELAGRLRRFRNHGIMPRPEMGGWFYEVGEVGYNARLTDIQAALGTSQLTKLDHFIRRRNLLASRYRELLGGLAIELPPSAPPGFTHAYHLFAIRVSQRRTVYEGMRERGVATQVHYVPIHHHPLYAADSYAWDLPLADAAYERLLSLPLFPGLTEAEQDHVVSSLREVL